MALPRWVPVVVAVAFMGVLVASLWMPWSRSQDCPLFEECGPWQDNLGIDVAGSAVLLAVFLALGLNLVLTRAPLFARTLGAVAMAFVGLALAIESQWGDFKVFGDVEFPLAGFNLACVATAASFAAWVWALLREAQDAHRVGNGEPVQP